MFWLVFKGKEAKTETTHFVGSPYLRNTPYKQRTSQDNVATSLPLNRGECGGCFCPCEAACFEGSPKDGGVVLVLETNRTTRNRLVFPTLRRQPHPSTPYQLTLSWWFGDLNPSPLLAKCDSTTKTRAPNHEKACLGDADALDFRQDYKAKGAESKLGELSVYSVGPSSEKGILVLPDVFGPT